MEDGHVLHAPEKEEMFEVTFTVRFLCAHPKDADKMTMWMRGKIRDTFPGTIVYRSSPKQLT